MRDDARACELHLTWNVFSEEERKLLQDMVVSNVTDAKKRWHAAILFACLVAVARNLLGRVTRHPLPASHSTSIKPRSHQIRVIF